MNSHYLIGVTFGILGGILTQFGQLLEKWVVNRVRSRDHEKGFLRHLVKEPVWVIGVVVGLGGGWAAYMVSQTLIGPALTPGLMAGGLVVLAIGSVRMNGENMNRSEIIGIGLMIIGIVCFGLSRLDITAAEVRTMLADQGAQLRIFVFTIGLLVLTLISRGLSRRILNRRGMLIAVANGFLSCLSDFWINPLIALVIIVLAGQAVPHEFVIFLMAVLILLLCASVITWQNQMAFKYAQASNVVPVAQVPIQIAPILVYFFIYALAPPSSISVFYMVSGSVLTIIAGFLLGRRKEIPAGDY